MESSLLYSEVESEEEILAAGMSETFSPTQWQREWEEKAHSKGHRAHLRRIVVAGTINACERGYYFHSRGGCDPACDDIESRRVALSPDCPYGELVCRQVALTQLLDYEDVLPRLGKKMKALSKKHWTINIRVEDTDTLSAALDMHSRGLNPLVLNMASPKRPGGGYQTGAPGQEESLFRQTNLHNVMVEDPCGFVCKERSFHYPLKEYWCIYSPEVLVFRSGEADGFRFLKEGPLVISVLTMSAYCRPKLEQTRSGPMLPRNVAEKTKNKIRMILETALAKGHDSLVLGAFGCGAFRNPPKHIARLFCAVIQREYAKAQHSVSPLREIVFAIIDEAASSRGEHNPEGNLKPFQEVFAQYM